MNAFDIGLISVTLEGAVWSIAKPVDVVLVTAIPSVVSIMMSYLPSSNEDVKSCMLAPDVFPRKMMLEAESWSGAAPLDLAKKVLNKNSPRLYISCGDEDEYGFFDGARKLALEIAKPQGVDVTWVPIQGGDHCTVDPLSTALFLEQGL